MVRYLTEILLAIMLIVTSADLIYLYSKGAWRDSIKVIEFAELGFLILFIAASLSYVMWRTNLMRREW